MGRSLPRVYEGFLHPLAEGEVEGCAIPIDSVAWYAWLEQHRSFSFEAHGLTFTARKEQRCAEGWYWYAYRRRQGKLHSAYLGKAAELTLQRLHTVATVLERAGEHALSASLSALVSEHNLPVQLTSLVGREQDVATAEALLRSPEVRLLSMVGTAGIGKTRLAIQAATDLLNDFRDGVYFVSLAPIRDPALVLSTIAQTFGLKESGNEPLADRLKAHLQHKHLLLVLDNFEQVVPAAPVLVELLTACRRLKLLVTSREVLHLGAEQQFSVPPLTLPDRALLPDIESLMHYAAVELFVQRAQAVKPDFQISESNAHAITEVCRLLDGLPLAIELAAARIKLLSSQALLARLDHRLQVLNSGARDLPERQRTLRTTLQWSYDLLNAREQRLFRQLSVFVGGCTLEAVKAVCEAPGDEMTNGVDGVASLIDKSLLQTTWREGEEPRLMMLETIREYGLECLATCGEMEATYCAHADYYLRMVEEAEPLVVGAEQAQWLVRLAQEFENIRAAMDWFLEREDAGKDFEVPMLLNAISVVWEIRGYLSEARQWFERLLTRSVGTVTLERAVALMVASRLAFSQDDLHQAERLAQEGLALFQKLDEKRCIGLSLILLGHVASRRHNYQKAGLLLEESVALLREWGFKRNLAHSLINFASVLSQQGKYTRARILAEEGLSLFRELNDQGGIAQALCCLAKVHFLQGEDHAARIMAEEGLAIARKVGLKSNIALDLHILGQIVLHQGDATTASALLMESLAIKRESESGWSCAGVLALLGSIAAFQGEEAQACSLFKESLAFLKDLDDRELIASLLEELAEVVLAQGGPTWAAQLWGAAERMREAVGALLPLDEHSSQRRAMIAARTQLGKEAFAAWAEGRAMSLEQVLDARRSVMSRKQVPPAAASATYPAELTQREVEVLRLVAQGLTIAQIAEQLIISFHTANAHVRSIYTKLDVTSRSAATRYAIEHHLV